MSSSAVPYGWPARVLRAVSIPVACLLALAAGALVAGARRASRRA